VDEHQTMIDRINKAGILVSSEMIAGTDSDTVESLDETANFVNRAKIAIPDLHIDSHTLHHRYIKNTRRMTASYRGYCRL
jgi:hypothetical protein